LKGKNFPKEGKFTGRAPEGEEGEVWTAAAIQEGVRRFR
jgi:hypothetical protein